MGKFIVMLFTWDDMDWLDACFEQIDYWKPDELYIGEGCWDSKFPARSTDGTRERVEKYADDNCQTWVFDNLRDKSYRENQANTIKSVMKLSNAKPGDWVMYQACDFYMLKKHIDIYKGLMAAGSFDYPIFEIFNFWNSTTKHFSKWAEMAVNLPWRLVEGYGWKPICHLAKDGILYNGHEAVKGSHVKVKGFHYEGFRKPERLKQKYEVGSSSDRESPVTWKGGIKLRNRDTYTGPHPEFVLPVLKEKGDSIMDRLK